MKKFYALLPLISFYFSYAQTNPLPQSLPYSQDFGTTVFTSPKTGMASWTGSGTRPYTSLTTAQSSFGGSDIAISSNSPTNGGSGGQYGHTLSGNGRLTILQSSNTTNGTSQAVLAIVTTGLSSVSISYDLALTIANLRSIGIALQYRVGTTGTFTTISGSATTYNSTTNNVGDLDGIADLDTYVFNLPGAALNQPEVQLRWITWRGGESGNSSGIGLDNIVLTGVGAVGDFSPPTISSLIPADNATGVAINATANLTFNETVQKGTGNIYVKRVTDNAVVQTFDVTSAAVTLSSTQISFDLSLTNNTEYYIEIDATAFKDLANNNFSGVSGKTTWNFTTIAPPQNGILENVYTFNNCGNVVNEGFKTFNVTGTQVWSCVKFGRTYTTDPSTDFAMEMNGFSGGSVQNEDWLISPKFDLSGTNVPLLDFYSLTRFQGPALTLKVSTDYSGTGNPSSATWTTINGRFPQEGSNMWMLSDSINLSAFKTSNVHIAWVYTSSTAAAAQWRIDDIKVFSSSQAALPGLEVIGSSLLDFRYVKAGTKSIAKTFSFYSNDLTSDLVITAPDGFEVSKDGSTFSSSVSFTPAESSTTLNTAFVRFSPTAVNVVYSGALSIISDNINQTSVFVKGNTQALSTSLQVVNWNIEWFGSTSQGPTNENLQMANAKKVMEYLDADVFGLAEIVSETSLATLTNSLSGDYSYVLGGFCSSGNTLTACRSAQKMALVYKNSVMSNVTARPLLITSPTAVSNWSSGRMPYLVNADVTKNCETKNINFIVIHAKANTGNTTDQIESYHRRKEGLIELKDTLDTHFADANIIILGDFNDDLDRTIAPTTGADTVSSYQTMVVDSTDGIHYTSVTLPLSTFGVSSTTSFPEMIDHVIISNELEGSYLNLSASVFNDIEEEAGVPNYASTTSDHYPILTRYTFEAAAPVVTSCPTVAPFCSTSTYNIPLFTADAACGNITYSYNITGATTRIGTSNDASGTFNVGTSTIEWIATDIFGKTASCQTTVIVNANPIVTIPDAFALSSGTLANTVYIGYAPASSITLTSNVTGGPITSYVWSSGATTQSITVSPTTNTTYSLTVKDENGCTATTSKTVNVVDIRTGKKTDKVLICHKANKQTNTLQIDPAAVPAHLAHGDMLAPCTNVMYTVAGNQSMTEDRTDTQLSVQVLPNPSTSHFIIITKGNAGKLSYTVTDALGRTVEQRTNMPVHNNFTIGSSYRPGVYIIKVTDGTSRQQIRLLKTSK